MFKLVCQLEKLALFKSKHKTEAKDRPDKGFLQIMKFSNKNLTKRVWLTIVGFFKIVFPWSAQVNRS